MIARGRLLHLQQIKNFNKIFIFLDLNAPDGLSGMLIK
jgi:hypothetical protein